MPVVASVDVDDGSNPGFVGPGVSVAVSRPVPTSEAEEDAPSEHDGVVSEAAPPCRVEEDNLTGTCKDGWHTAQQESVLLRGTIVNRTYGIHKNLYI